MNNTIALPELAAYITQRTGCDSETATRFVVALFAEVEKKLLTAGSAYVGGIGTFSRNSKGGIEFEAEASLAASVNSPFAMFEPIELPPDVPDTIAGQGIGEEQHPDIPAPATDTPESDTEEDTPVIASENNEQQPAEYSSDECEPAEPCAYTCEEPESEYTPAAEPAEAIAAPATDRDYYDYEPQRRSPWPWIAAVACLLVGLAAGYWIGSRYAAPSPVLVSQAVIEEDDSTSVKPAVIEEDTCATDTTPADTIRPVSPAVQKEPVYDTVTSSRFLTTIARDHYGRKDFWVFIYEANSDILRHPNRIRPGTKVLVPDLGEHAAMDSALRARAHVLANEIYRRYDL